MRHAARGSAAAFLGARLGDREQRCVSEARRPLPRGRRRPGPRSPPRGRSRDRPLDLPRCGEVESSLLGPRCSASGSGDHGERPTRGDVRPPGPLRSSPVLTVAAGCSSTEASSEGCGPPRPSPLLLVAAGCSWQVRHPGPRFRSRPGDGARGRRLCPGEQDRVPPACS